MEINHNSTSDGPENSTFWKKISKPLPGRAIIRKEVRSTSEKNSSSASFEDFEENVRSAWYVGPDDYCSISNEYNSNQFECSSVSRVRKNDPAKTFVSRDIQTQPSHESSEESSHEVHLIVIDSPSSPLTDMDAARGVDIDATVSRVAKFRSLLSSPLLNLDDLRCLSWSGIPDEVRPTTWKLLAGYLPANLERRQSTIKQKRLEYWNLKKQYFNKRRDDENDKTYRQIHIDIPRMSPLIALFQQKTVQEMFERILYIWAIRHPASGYVQGINDLVTPFYVVFLQDYLPPGVDLDTIKVDTMPENHRNNLEADTFWCFSKFLNGIQDNYIFAQIGIQFQVKRLKELIRRVDGELDKQLQTHEIDYIQFSFRWMNNMLMREIPLRCSVRLWDTYLSESEGFASFHLYVCTAFLLHWRQQLLLERDFQGLMIMLQNLPTRKWTDSDINVLLAKAFILKYSFDDAPNHLQRN